ncbi:unnamed protein product [Cyprideis torosa]|uniref:ZSWIM4-8 C-terminal domain-containing protein n=1 Tax=Cyprideis torosa TaxID=163714 RepID=A0A7R8WB37_9CRUS|nr:unnamed protein product [Cyprideis torosa]CAG0886034.1 unnamed protein product [Cyprideis torosa]
MVRSAGVSRKLGSSFLTQFIIACVNAVFSPFVLLDIAMEVANFLSRNPPHTHYTQHLRSPVLQPIVTKCQQMFIQCTHHRLYHITPTEYEEFVSIIRTARQAFQMTPTGMVQFNELLQSLRRSKSCKKELWTRINRCLSQGNSNNSN